MLRYMLDTNICIYVMRSQPERLRQRFNRFSEQLCISTVVLGELVYGAEKSAKPAENLLAIEQFCSNLEVLPFSDRAAHHYGQIRASLQRSGQPIGSHDLMIAGHARSEGFTLVTNNQRELARVDGLRVENWT
jgi:tRNA(fMet)-specific endonuclease VapC